MSLPVLDELIGRPELEVLVAVEGPLCRLTLNRPARLNALTEPLRHTLELCVAALAREPSVAVVCLDGAGRAFCAGMDRNERDSPFASPDPQVRWQALDGWRRVLDGIEQLPQVSVASLRGPVIGGGLLLAIACDLRIAADDMTASAPEVVMGGIPAANGMQRLAREIGLPRTRDLLLTGRALTAAEACDWGLATRVVPAADLGAATENVLGRLLEVPGAALSRARRGMAAHGRAMGGVEVGWADSDLMAAALDTIR